jgi:hypothetical protein
LENSRSLSHDWERRGPSFGLIHGDTAGASKFDDADRSSVREPVNRRAANLISVRELGKREKLTLTAASVIYCSHLLPPETPRDGAGQRGNLIRLSRSGTQESGSEYGTLASSYCDD